MEQGWIIAIGASGGKGLEDICVILATRPPALEAIVLTALHRPWDVPSHLVEVLSRRL